MVTIGGVQYPFTSLKDVNLTTLNAAHQGKLGAGIYEGIIVDAAKSIQLNFKVHICYIEMNGASNAYLFELTADDSHPNALNLWNVDTYPNSAS